MRNLPPSSQPQNAQLQTTKRELVEAEAARNVALESLRLSETRVAEADSESQRFSEKIAQLEATILRLQVGVCPVASLGPLDALVTRAGREAGPLH
jgi:hypothetical protein